MGSRFEEVQQLIHEFIELYPDAEYGFAHIVLSDYNLEDHWIEDVLENPHDDYPDVRDATANFLKQLLEIPEDDRVPDRGDDN
jgi:hypothetical protein